jgi:lipopolysaccharide transport system ATP-binding protein
MREPAIRVTGLGKEYRIGAAVDQANTLRDSIAAGARGMARAARSPFAAYRGRKRNGHQTFWALQDVTFDVAPGEVVGIIGQNGAGKSTLLKVLSRITEPTAGQIEMRGRVGSLLEVGTGFHSELTGRENTYLNGAILGMTRTEISAKFDEIVEFAEIERFIDTPVKHYSSGMYLRLAFAVAAHLEPEILMVDEVLAVGDAAFQQKCLGKMNEVSREGRTVLFVSHNLDAIQTLCTRCLLLEDGRVVADTDPGSVVLQYLGQRQVNAGPRVWFDLSSHPRLGTGEARFAALMYSGIREENSFHPIPEGAVEFWVAVDSDADRAVGSFAIAISTAGGTVLVNTETQAKRLAVHLKRGRNIVRVGIPQLHLNPGVYRVDLWMADPLRTTGSRSAFDHLNHVCDLEIVNVAPTGLVVEQQGLVTCEVEVSSEEEANALVTDRPGAEVMS